MGAGMAYSLVIQGSIVAGLVLYERHPIMGPAPDEAPVAMPVLMDVMPPPAPAAPAGQAG